MYIALSPFTLWTLDFRASLDNVDVSAVTAIKLAFTGSAMGLHNSTVLKGKAQ